MKLKPTNEQYRAAAERLHVDNESPALSWRSADQWGSVQRVADGAWVQINVWVPKVEAEKESE